MAYLAFYSQQVVVGCIGDGGVFSCVFFGQVAFQVIGIAHNKPPLGIIDGHHRACNGIVVFIDDHIADLHPHACSIEDGHGGMAHATVGAIGIEGDSVYHHIQPTHVKQVQG